MRRNVCQPTRFLNAKPLDHRLDVISHDGCQPDRLLPALLASPAAVRSENPIFGLSIWRFAKPIQKIPHRVFVDGHRLLRGFRLAPTDDLVHDGSLDINLQVLKIECPATSAQQVRRDAALSPCLTAQEFGPEAEDLQGCPAFQKPPKCQERSTRLELWRTPAPRVSPLIGFRSVNSHRIA